MSKRRTQFAVVTLVDHQIAKGPLEHRITPLPGTITNDVEVEEEGKEYVYQLMVWGLSWDHDFAIKGHVRLEKFRVDRRLSFMGHDRGPLRKKLWGFECIENYRPLFDSSGKFTHHRQELVARAQNAGILFTCELLNQCFQKADDELKRIQEESRRLHKSDISRSLRAVS